MGMIQANNWQAALAIVVSLVVLASAMVGCGKQQMYYEFDPASDSVVIHNSPLGEKVVQLDTRTPGTYVSTGFTQDRAHTWEIQYGSRRLSEGSREWVVFSVKWNGKDVPSKSDLEPEAQQD